jgi:hypothetical protein
MAWLRAALVAFLLVLIAAAPAGAAKVRAPACPAGSLVLKGTKAKPRCAPIRLGRARPATPGDARAQLGQVADALRQALVLVPGATSKLDRKAGKARRVKLVALALDGWERPSGSGRTARARARAHAADATTTTFGRSGAGGSATFTVNPVDNGTLGFRAGVEATVRVDKDGLRDFARDLPAGLSGGEAKVRLSFSDVAQSCPSAAGKVTGRLDASGSLEITVRTADGPVSVELSAEASMLYTVTVGEDGKWKTIDEPEFKATFKAGGTGQRTRTYRSRLVGGSFGTTSILSQSGGAMSGAIEAGMKDGMSGGASVSGPFGTETMDGGGRTTRFDPTLLLDYKNMMATVVASHVLKLAAIEYVRGVTLPRSQRRWYDEEGCMGLDGSAAPSDKLDPGATATVTVSGAKARDGGAVPATLTATGTASITPPGASMAAGGSNAFTLTAPGDAPSTATWSVAGVSRAGRKTVSGAIPVVKAPVPVAFSGVIEQQTTAPAFSEQWSGKFTYTRTSLDTYPDGSSSAWYELTGLDDFVYVNTMYTACGAYMFDNRTAAPKGRINGGDLELLIAPDGSMRAASISDINLYGANMPATGVVPRGCPGALADQNLSALSNTYTLADQKRPVPADFTYSSGPTSDILYNTNPAGLQYTMDWDLRPRF